MGSTKQQKAPERVVDSYRSPTLFSIRVSRMIDKRELELFLNEIRNCHRPQCKLIPCVAGERCTPFVYGKTTSDILVVSEVPQNRAWSDNKGAMWKGTLNVTQEGIDIQSMVSQWLDIVPEAEERFFWIQRANCAIVKADRIPTFQRCSRLYLSRAVELVDPKLIVTLGGHAANFFYHSAGTLRDLLEIWTQGRLKPKKHQSYDIIPFYHPSGRAGVHRLKPDNLVLHEKIVEMAREKIRSFL
ncbi:MAG: hypothetical protein E3J86_00320 [Candidatus Thorarchaeota archaeon]|nr:MAG: hypothetical protein E3J86_00320 [Candidatus Thorarchaeota archaeon]